MDYAKANKYALELKKRLTPFCEKVEIAGSTRRKKPNNIKDIELVAIPKMIDGIGDLFTSKKVREPGFYQWCKQYQILTGDPETGKYCQILLNEELGLKLDLFIVTRENWGWQFLLRTGPADFTKKLILPALRRRKILSVDGYLTKGGETIETPKEETVFALLEWKYIEPNFRDIAVKTQEYSRL